jgi:hypothetical protein
MRRGIKVIRRIMDGFEEKKRRKGGPGPVVVVVIASCARKPKGKETWK